MATQLPWHHRSFQRPLELGQQNIRRLPALAGYQKSLGLTTSSFGRDLKLAWREFVVGKLPVASLVQFQEQLQGSSV
jgi:hypothetical protein